jgi:hypothetical protein
LPHDNHRAKFGNLAVKLSNRESMDTMQILAGNLQHLEPNGWNHSLRRYIGVRTSDRLELEQSNGQSF